MSNALLVVNARTGKPILLSGGTAYFVVPKRRDRCLQCGRPLKAGFVTESGDGLRHWTCDLRRFETAIPVMARLKRGREGWLWVVEKCPYCGERHVHGGGGLDDDPVRFLGDRAAPCKQSNDLRVAYVLVQEMG